MLKSWPVAQLVERPPVKREVAGSTPAGPVRGPRTAPSHGLSSVGPESTRGSLPDNQEGRYGGRASLWGGRS